MKLLLESKRMWLLSYVICTSIPMVLYCFSWDNLITKTIGIMFIEIQAIMFVFFLLILIFKWKAYCRTVATLIYLGLTIYEGINDNLVKWYIIIPVFLVTEVYMLWNLGGVVNCVIASSYRERLNSKVREGIDLYDLYSKDLEKYNERNELGFFTKVKKKREPIWEILDFNYTALQMFYFEYAFVGINELVLYIKERKLNEINRKLYDKNNALHSNLSIHEEKDSINKIVNKAKLGGLEDLNFDYAGAKENLEIMRKKNIKKEKHILRRRL